MPTSIHSEDVQVMPLLSAMRLPKSALLDILGKVAGERANVRDTDPNSAAGYETWRWGTRFLREDPDLADLKWVQCESRQVEGIRNDELRLKLVICSMDRHTGNPDPEKMPRNVRERGAAARKLIARNGRQLAMAFMDNPSPNPIDDYDFWYFAVCISDDFVAAEISRADSVTDKGYIEHYSDRIIIAKLGDLDGLRSRDSVPEEFAEIEKPALRRKST